MIDPTNIQSWLSVGALVISLTGIAYSWFTAKSKVNSEHLKRVDEKLETHQARIARMENELVHLPAKDDVVELKLAIVRMEGTVGKLGESLSGVSRTVHLVDEYFRKVRKD